MRREQLVGEGVVAFSCSKPLQTMTKLRLTLEPRSNLSVRTFECQNSKLVRTAREPNVEGETFESD